MKHRTELGTNYAQIHIQGDGDSMADCSVLLKDVEDIVGNKAACFLDLREMNFMSAGFYRVLISLYKKANLNNTKLSLIVMPNSHIQRVLNTTGLTEIMDTYLLFNGIENTDRNSVADLAR